MQGTVATTRQNLSARRQAPECQAVIFARPKISIAIFVLHSINQAGSIRLDRKYLISECETLAFELLIKRIRTCTN